jgi:hypothetical protein
MHQYKVGSPFVAVSYFPCSDQGNQHLPITRDCFTEWPESYALPFQETSTVAEPLVTIFFCCSDYCGGEGGTNPKRKVGWMLQKQEVPAPGWRWTNTHHRYYPRKRINVGKSVIYSRRIALRMEQYAKNKVINMLQKRDSWGYVPWNVL